MFLWDIVDMSKFRQHELCSRPNDELVDSKSFVFCGEHGELYFFTNTAGELPVFSFP